MYKTENIEVERFLKNLETLMNREVIESLFNGNSMALECLVESQHKLTYNIQHYNIIAQSYVDLLCNWGRILSRGSYTVSLH